MASTMRSSLGLVRSERRWKVTSEPTGDESE
jgi:hypothetical protein